MEDNCFIKQHQLKNYKLEIGLVLNKVTNSNITPILKL